MYVGLRTFQSPRRIESMRQQRFHVAGIAEIDLNQLL
jgi:hypothetical protein